MSGNRIKYLDLAKGFGILLVVWAHAKGPFSNNIYQFHMPFFFLISGYLYNQSDSWGTFFLKKMKTLYMPFAFWNLFFCWGKRIVIHKMPSFSYMMKETWTILLTLNKDGEWCGASWFLGSLFVVAVTYKSIDVLFSKITNHNNLEFAIFVGLGILGFLVTFPYLYSRTLICGMFYAMGVFWKNHKACFDRYSNGTLAIACAILFGIISENSVANMGTNQYTNRLLFVIGALSASYALLHFCVLFDKANNGLLASIKKVLIECGKNSIDIVIWQFVFFRVGIIAQMLWVNEPLTYRNVLSHYPMYDPSHGWWFVYFLLGVILPLIWGKLLRLGPWGKLLKKVCIV